MKSLQRLLVRSRAVKLLAIRQVTQQNRGRHTTGGDITRRALVATVDLAGSWAAIETDPMEALHIADGGGGWARVRR